MQAKILQKLRKNKEMTQQQLADYLGVSKSFIGQVETGASKLPDDKKLKVNELFLVDIDKLSNDKEFINPPKKYKIPVRRNMRSSAGHGCYVLDEKITDYIEVTEDDVKKLDLDTDKSDFLIVSGESMFPTIFDGDYILVDRSKTDVIDGKIYVIEQSGDIMVKRLQKLPDGLRVISDNKEYETYNITDNYKVCGRVVRMMRDA